jgi:hypothetical protein
MAEKKAVPPVDIPHYVFLDTFENIAVDKGLRLVMQRQPLGCGIQFYFVHPKTRTYSKSLTLFSYRDNIVDFLDKLDIHADEFLKEIEGKSNQITFDFDDLISEGGNG